MNDILTPQPIDSATKAKLEAINLGNYNKWALQNMIDNYEHAFKLVWNNPSAPTQDILNQFGTSAVQLFAASAKIAALIKELKPDYVSPIPGGFTINQDGTVTINI